MKSFVQFYLAVALIFAISFTGAEGLTKKDAVANGIVSFMWPVLMIVVISGPDEFFEVEETSDEELQ